MYWGEIGEVGGKWTRVSLGEWSENFFNRSPLILKFEAEKIRERESSERERESESESEQARSKASELLSFLRS